MLHEVYLCGMLAIYAILSNIYLLCTSRKCPKEIPGGEDIHNSDDKLQDPICSYTEEHLFPILVNW